MLSNYFEDPRTLEQLGSGPAGSYIDGFANHLHFDGYAAGTARRYLRAAVHLGLWMDTANCLIEELNEETLAAFASHLPCWKRGQKRGQRKGVKSAFGSYIVYSLFPI